MFCVDVVAQIMNRFGVANYGLCLARKPFYYPPLGVFVLLDRQNL